VVQKVTTRGGGGGHSVPCRAGVSLLEGRRYSEEGEGYSIVDGAGLSAGDVGQSIITSVI